MDPNATVERINEMWNDGELEEFVELLKDLWWWISRRRGFWPSQRIRIADSEGNRRRLSSVCDERTVEQTFKIIAQINAPLEMPSELR